MSNFSDFFPKSLGGGGGSTNQTTLDVGGVQYPILSGDMQDNWDAYINPYEFVRPSNSQTAFNQPSQPFYSTPRPSHSSITSGTLPTSTTSYTSVFNDTSGGGIFWWAYGHLSNRVGYLQTQLTQLDMRITIDGGTPIVLSTPSSTLTYNGGSVGGSSFVGSHIALGLPLFKEQNYRVSQNYDNYPPTFAALNRYPLIPNTTSSSNGIFTNAISNALSQTGYLSPYSYGSRLTFMFYDADISRRYNIPGFKYETSLNIEFATTWTNYNSGATGYACCVTQF